MKRIFAVTIGVILLIGNITCCAFGDKLPFDNFSLSKAGETNTSDEIRVMLYGSPVQFEEQKPIIKNGRTLVPFRAIFEALNAEVTWDKTEQTVTADVGETNIVLKIGDTNAMVNGEAKALDQAAEIIENTTMVPLRFIGEALGAQVTYLENNKIVSIQRTERPLLEADEDQGPLIMDVGDGAGIDIVIETGGVIGAVQEEKRDDLVAVYARFDTLDEVDKCKASPTVPTVARRNVDRYLDFSEKAPGVSNNVASVHLTFNPDGEEVKNQWGFWKAAEDGEFQGYQDKGAKAISFWIKGDTDSIEEPMYAAVIIRAKATHRNIIGAEEADYGFYARIDKYVTDKEWNKVTIPLKSNGAVNNHDISTGFYANEPGYEFNIADIKSIRFIVNTRNVSSKEVKEFKSVSFWLDHIEIIK